MLTVFLRYLCNLWLTRNPEECLLVDFHHFRPEFSHIDGGPRTPPERIIRPKGTDVHRWSFKGFPGTFCLSYGDLHPSGNIQINVTYVHGDKEIALTPGYNLITPKGKVIGLPYRFTLLTKMERFPLRNLGYFFPIGTIDTHRQHTREAFNH